MKKITLIVGVAFVLSSCGNSKYLPCPAYSSSEHHDTEGIHENLTEEEYYELIAQQYGPDCENCDEID